MILLELECYGTSYLLAGQFVNYPSFMALEPSLPEEWTGFNHSRFFGPTETLPHRNIKSNEEPRARFFNGTNRHPTLLAGDYLGILCIRGVGGTPSVCQ